MSAAEKKMPQTVDVLKVSGEKEVAKIFSQWRDNDDAGLNDAAFRLGQLVSADMLSPSRARSLIDVQLGMRHYPPEIAPLGERSLDAGRGTQVAPEYFLKKEAANDDLGLPVIDPSDWHGLPVPERKWIVDGFIPDRTVTLFSGDGGSGKSMASISLMIAMALGLPWFDLPVTQGPTLYFGAEDEQDELHIRINAILGHHGKTFADLVGRGVRLIPMADRDPVLAAPDKEGRMLETDVFPMVRGHAEVLQPKLIVIDTSADAFGGDEVNRKQVRRFISMLRALAIKIDCAVLLLSHPSLTGISSGSGLSGSTAWNNSVRSRLYMTTDEKDTNVRTITTKKTNYGALGAEISIRWSHDDSVFVLNTGSDAGADVVDTLVGKRHDKLFIELLTQFTEQGQHLSPKPCVTYAPKVMSKHSKARGISKEKLAAAMQRLLDAKRIRIVTEGSPSRERSRLVVAESGATE